MAVRHLIAIALMAAGGVGLAVRQSGRAPSALARVRDAGVIRVGYANEPPWAWRDDSGRVTGEAPTALRAAAGAIGIDSIEWVQAPFRALLTDLRGGRVDVVASGVYRTPEREREFAFTRPTLAVPTALLVRAADTGAVRDLASLRAVDGTVLAVVSGAQEEVIAREAGWPGARVVRVPDAATGRAAVLSGRVSALALSLPSLHRLRAARGDSSALAIRRAYAAGAAPGAAIGRPALVFRLADDDLRRAMDDALAAWLGSPAHLAAVAPFGFTGADLPAAGRAP